MPRTEEELMDMLGSETALAKVADAAEAASAMQEGQAVADYALKAASLMGAGGGGSIRGMQRELAAVGMPVRPTGTLDAATVDAINEIFQGWDDAPAALRSGNLTAKQISNNLPAVSRYLKQAVGGAQEFGDATKDG